MHKKSSAGTGTYSIIFGVAFVWFTTHFGGGFASGAQIYSYYVRFGIWCLIMPALAMLYNGIFLPTAYALPGNTKYTITARTTMLFTENSPQFFPTCLKCSISVSCVSLLRLPLQPAVQH